MSHQSYQRMAPGCERHRAARTRQVRTILAGACPSRLATVAASAAVVLALLLGLPATGARAQAGVGAAESPPASAEANAARARELFALGVEATEQHELAAAESHFRAALALRDAPAIRYNLASVLFERGQLTEADALARSAAADETASADIREHAATLATQIAAAAGFVRVDVIGDAGASITLDGFVLVDASAEVPVSPAEHVLAASSGGVERARETFTVALGEHRVVPIDASGAEDAGTADAVDEGEADGAGRPLVEEPALWIGVGAGVAVVLTIVIVAVAVSSAGTEGPIEGNLNPGVIRW